MKKRVDLSVGWAEGDLLDGVLVGDHWACRIIEVTFPGAEGSPGLSMTIDSSDGVPRCTRLEITAREGGREVRTSDVRAVEIPTWIDAIVPLFMGEVDPTEDGGTALTLVSPDEEAARRRAMSEVRTVQRAGRRLIDEKFLRRVAEVYTSDPVRPAQAVKHAFGVSPRTAARYVQQARSAGLLATKEKGRG